MVKNILIGSVIAALGVLNGYQYIHAQQLAYDTLITCERQYSGISARDCADFIKVRDKVVSAPKAPEHVQSFFAQDLPSTLNQVSDAKKAVALMPIKKK